MARERKEKRIKNIKLKKPDRSAPSETTLLQMAEQRELFQQAAERERELKRKSQHSDEDGEDESEDEGLSPGAERFLEAVLYTVTLSMLHFTFDVLVQNQYGHEIQWRTICVNSIRAWFVFAFLFYPLHPHEANPILIPGIPKKYQHYIRQIIFFSMSISAGCYLVYITNAYGYLAILKQAPPLACLWLWAVFELDLPWACLSLAIAAGFVYQGGYDIK